MISAGDHEIQLDHGRRERRCFLHVSKAALERERIPLVVGFHGGLGTADALRRQSLLERLADREGFAIAFPDGIGRFKHRMLTWNAGSCCGYAMRSGVDDVGFTQALLDELGRALPVDVRRTYAVGFSNGGMLAYRLACEVPERFAAIGVVSCTLTVDGPTPALPMPVIHLHGLSDRNVSFEGGVGENQFSRTDYRPVAETIAWWVRVNRCDPTPVSTVDEPDSRTVRYQPPKGQDGAPVVLVTIPEGGHTWPGGVDITERLNTGKLVASVDASRRIWDFVSAFQR